jgi:CO/xanthine dehydrogenase Mo-binding subunit
MTTLVMPQVEMGQGVYTAVAMILADELDGDFSQVVLEHAPPNDKLYGNPIFGFQVTGNSNSIRAFWKPLRIAGAAARAMLVQAAASQWQVDPASCTAANGQVTHAASGRTAAYGDLADSAAALPVPANPPLKDPKDFTLIGKSLKRLDTPNKSDGKVIYAVDAILPDMKIATLAQSPVFGGKVAHVDDSAVNGIDIDAVDSAVDMPYDIPNRQVAYVHAEPPAVPTGFWRGVGPNNNVFAIECFMDELARKANMDPVEFRRGMLGNNPRLKAALDLVAEKSGWGQPLPPRAGRGVSVQPSFGSFIATVVEAEVDNNGEVHLRRVTSAVDTGIAVNPDTIMAQLEGGLIFGLTAALWGEITIYKGRVRQSNFNDYRMLRIDEVPNIEVHVIKSSEDPGGIGETGTNAGPPALRNAIYAATGVALRRLPIDRAALAVKKA